MSDKRKNKKDSFTGKKRKPWNRETNSNTNTLTEGVAATDRG